MYRPTDSVPAHYKSWTSGPSSHSAPSHSTASPGPTPRAPHLHTVSLPHPNSAPRHVSSSSDAPYPSPSAGSSRILSLNPLLSFAGVPPVYYNVTQGVQFVQLRPGCPTNLLHAPAVHPTCTVLVLSAPSLPLWSTIEVRNPRGVSAYDVLVRIHDVLDRSVSPREMGATGVKRIDFLGPNVFFAGLSRARDGQDRWEVYFVPRA